MDVSRWTINEWKVEGTGKIPEDAFGQGADLLILNKGSNPCPVVWVDAQARLCWIESLPIDGSVPVSVHFGPREVPCYVSFTVTPGGQLMSGTLQEVAEDGNDGNAGTFAAEGSGPPPPDPSGD